MSASSDSDSKMSTSSDSESESGYTVEEIIDKRIRNGYVEYYLKWKDYSSCHNSWEHEGNLECFALIQAFEEKLEREKNARTETDAAEVHEAYEAKVETKVDENEPCCSSPKENESDLKLGLEPDAPCVGSSKKEKTSCFERGCEPDKIVGASDITGEMVFLLQFKDGNMELITAKEAKEYCIQLLIDFYEDNLSF